MGHGHPEGYSHVGWPQGLRVSTLDNKALKTTFWTHHCGAEAGHTKTHIRKAKHRGPKLCLL